MLKFFKIYLLSLLIFLKKNINLMKYIIAGLVSYLIYLIFLSISIEIFNFNKLLSAILTYGIAMIFNFLILKIWVFKFSSNVKKTFIKYNIIGLSGYFLNNIGFWLLVEFLDMYYLKAQFILFILISTSNYILNTLWTFNSENK